MVQTETIRIAYDGPALANGAMDIKDLAPALLAFADLVKRANTVIGNKRPIDILLTADDIHKGSFDISMQLVYSTLEQAKLFTGFMEESGLNALIEVLGFGSSIISGGVYGVFQLIKALKNRKVSNVQQDANTGVTMITLSDGTQIKTTAQTLNVFVDHEVRKNIESVIRPLRKSGIDSFEFRKPYKIEDKNALFSIQKDEIEYFDSPKLETVEVPDNITEQELIVRIVSVVFEKNQKWRFSDGESSFWAKIDDEEFWSRVQEGNLAFRDGDQLKVKIQSVQKITNNNLTTEKVIVKVIDAIHKPTQIKLIE